ncbi:septum formation inhibitor Maf [Endozoicomonas sp. SM1973]|uniref:7-methyl-GTP pyrophosphatase n=1 Tax=Spartinivicinus marinus TaxID=2994442 RepID=A0A853ICA4_9GAMM|nr:nucleoside triphosphate pyrophosphatase [Spartinivicinus marinus]MCX4029432.1 Maf family protein [Spartinivicinus marinus]NYZ65006.1 septum formation inhibitor Maf [Spartinivicinus marinus]
MTDFQLILASSSPYRKALLNKLQLPFLCRSPDIDEKPLNNEPPEQMTKRLTIAKAAAVAQSYGGTNHLIISSDQVASLKGQLLGKPGNFQNAQQQLRASSGNTVVFYTGLCVWNCKTKEHLYEASQTKVTFKTLTDQTISRYLQIDQPFDCAGSFKCESLGIALFSKLETDDPNSLIGLPLIRLVDMLERMEVKVL